MTKTTKTEVDCVSREAIYSAFFLGVAAGALLAFVLSAVALP